MTEEREVGLIPHEWITVNIGEGAYRFRTLSIKQIFTCQTALRAMTRQLATKTKEEIAALTDADRAEVISAQRVLLESVCPTLTQIKSECGVNGCDDDTPHADYLHLTGEQLTAIIRFYMAQKWGVLADMLAIGEDGDKPKNSAESEETFRTLCAVVGKFYGNSFDDFINLRFEEAAARVIACAKSWGEKDSKGKSTLEEFFDQMAGSMGLTMVEGEAPVQTEAPGVTVQTTPPIN